MARVHFKEGQPIQSLSGTIGNMTYRTRNGKTFVHCRRPLLLAADASRAERETYRRRQVVNECVGIIQDEMEDFVEAIRSRPRIRAAMSRLYRQYSPEISGRVKLQRKMLSVYRLQYGCIKSDKSARKVVPNTDKVGQKV